MELIILPLLLVLGLGFLLFDDGNDGGSDTDETGGGSLGEGENGELLDFGDEADAAYGTGGADTVALNGGDDAFDGGAGDDTIDGGAGNDSISGGAGDDTISLGDGDDTSAPGMDLSGIVGLPEGSAGAAGDDTINGGAGDDDIRDMIGANELNGDAGNDTLDGRDAVFNRWAADALDGGEGDDTLIGDGGDFLTGGEGVDAFEVLSVTGAEPVVITDFTDGESLLIREPGPEAISADRITSVASENGEDTNILLDGEIVAVLQGVQTLPSGSVANVLGASGSGGFSGPALFGTDGDDTIVAGDIPRVFSGDGDDTISLNETGVSSPDDLDMQVNAGHGSDTVIGGGGDDLIFGNLGADTIVGNEGSDDLFGGFGGDLISSYDQSTDSPDTVDGGGGDDAIVADDGDTVTGGSGTDIFVGAFDEADDDAVTITDFDPATETIEAVMSLGAGAALPVVGVVPTADGTGSIIQAGGRDLFVLEGVLAANANAADIVITNFDA